MGKNIEALRSGSKRTKTHDAQMVFKLPAAVKELVESIGREKFNDSAAEVVRDALGEYLEKRGYRI